ncbi:MAG: tRNA (adenosine(37)-N6)-dimethylallyltransferase MiaA, partial [Alcaligenes sp.]
LTISLEPSDRAALHARIEQRFDAMLAKGLLDEVRTLRARPDLHPGLPSVRCVGYRQMWAHLDGEVDLATAREQGIAATRQLAKRQITWLRAQPDRVIVDCLASDAVAQTIDAVAMALAGKH